MHELPNEPPSHVPASAEVTFYHRATIDILSVWIAVHYLHRNRSDLRYFRAYEEHGQDLFADPELVADLNRPEDGPLGFLMPLIETGLVVTYARPFTKGYGSGYPLPDDVLPSDPGLLAMHEFLLRLRGKVYAHIDDTDDTPWLRAVERFPAVEGGFERERFQERGTPRFRGDQLEMIERLANAVGKNLEERLKAAKRSELAREGRCAECGRLPTPDENRDEWRAGSDGAGNLHVFCPECWKREFGQGLQ